MANISWESVNICLYIYMCMTPLIKANSERVSDISSFPHNQNVGEAESGKKSISIYVYWMDMNSENRQRREKKIFQVCRGKTFFFFPDCRLFHSFTYAQQCRSPSTILASEWKQMVMTPNQVEWQNKFPSVRVWIRGWIRRKPNVYIIILVITHQPNAWVYYGCFGMRGNGSLRSLRTVQQLSRKLAYRYNIISLPAAVTLRSTKIFD